MSTLVEQLSAYGAGLRYGDLPPEVVRQAKRLIVDTVGCALGGHDAEPARIAREIAEDVTSARPATVLVSGRATSPDLAAALACAEIARRSGRDLLTATVLAGRLRAEAVKAIALPEVGQAMARQGLEAETATPQELAARIRKETALWAAVIREAGIELE
ncbi:MAG TPA: MmgE/PrpD family protein [Burkholderiales bacterium]|nr:MmgE/PrpD family protein [Burkholderiales bacterium]